MDTSLCLIDAGLTSLYQADLHGDLHHLNVHCNALTRIQGLENLLHLVVLDLSANSIQEISGLGSLRSLRVLNLSCNCLRAAQGLAGLRSLQYLDLSHNQISSLAGLDTLHAGSGARLAVLYLHGNLLQSVAELSHCVAFISHSLQHLTVWCTGEGGNPLGLSVDFSSSATVAQLIATLWGRLSNLISLNGWSRDGQIVAPPQPTDFIEAYWLPPTRQDNGSSDTVFPTPHIDHVMGLMQARRNTSLGKSSVVDGDLSNTANSTSVLESFKGGQSSLVDGEDPVRDVRSEYTDQTQPSGSSSSIKQRRHNASKRQSSPKKGQQQQKSSVVKIASQGNLCSDGMMEDLVRRQALLEEDLPAGMKAPLLGSQLQLEVERRVKAEHALQVLNTTVHELKQQVHAVRGAGLHWKEKSKEASELVKGLEEQLHSLRQEAENSQADRRHLETAYKEEKAKLLEELECLQRASVAQKTELSELRQSSADEIARLRVTAERSSNEADALRTSMAAQTAQMQFMQDMISKFLHREHEAPASSSPEELCRLLRAVTVERDTEESHTKQLKKELAVRERQYRALEDEFRSALRVEASRFLELQRLLENQEAQTHSLRESVTEVRNKEMQARAVVTKLTAVVREQQERLHTLAQERAEMDQPDEAHVESLQKIASLESVIRELKEEQTLWRQERAEQGGLVRMRVELEAEVSRLSTQVGELKAHVQEGNDALLIKAKMLDDKDATIRQQKAQLAEANAHLDEMQRLSSECEQLSEQVDMLVGANKELHEQVTALMDRKEELKHERSTLQDELADQRAQYQRLEEDKERHNEQVRQLGVEIERVKMESAQRQDACMQERNAALEKNRALVDKLKDVDTAFRKQLQSATIAHEEKLQHLREQTDRQVLASQAKVQEVEEELRHLLAERQRKVEEFASGLRHLESVVLSGQG